MQESIVSSEIDISQQLKVIFDTCSMQFDGHSLDQVQVHINKMMTSEGIMLVSQDALNYIIKHFNCSENLNLKKNRLSTNSCIEEIVSIMPVSTTASASNAVPTLGNTLNSSDNLSKLQVFTPINSMSEWNNKS